MSAWIVCSVLGGALLAGGCGNAQKDSTEAAINAAQGAINSVQDEAAKYVPEQLQAANNSLQSARDALAKGDYGGALAFAKDATGRTKELAEAAAAKKQEWTQIWASLKETIPRSLEAVKVKLDAYSRRAPAGPDEDKLAEAKMQYERLKQTWAEASGAETQGKLGEAIKKASGLKEALAQLQEKLGLKS
jgi:hypothetical protein